MKKIKYIFLLLAVIYTFIALPVSSLASSPTSFSALNDDIKISLYKGKDSDNRKFELKNILPGDIETRSFSLSISHKDKITIFFDIEVGEDKAALSEILIVKVSLPLREQPLYFGPLSQFPEGGVGITLGALEDGADIVSYTVEISMPESAGNEYSSATLEADLKWYAKDNSGLIYSGEQLGTREVIICLGIMCGAIIAAILILLLIRKILKARMIGFGVGGKLFASVCSIAVLSLGFAATTLYLTRAVLPESSDLFETATVKINLNDGESVIGDQALVIAPGTEVKKSFFVRNEGSCDVYYKISFNNISGTLADVIRVKICDGEFVIYEGALSALEDRPLFSENDILSIGERLDLTATFIFPSECGNEMQGASLSFGLSASAVQVKNNDGRVY